MYSSLLFVVLLIGAATVSASKVPIASPPDPNDAMLLDSYTPAPRIVVRAETVEGLLAATKPTVAWNADMLWVKRDEQHRLSFVFATAQWVRLGKARPFWALLRRHDPDTTERDSDGLATSDIRNASVRDLAGKKSESDDGGRDYAQVILHDRGYDVYEIGIQSEGLGTGHPVEKRRIYVLRRPDGSWRFVGEGPAESSGKSGYLCSWSATATHASLTGDPKTPVVLEFSTTDGSDLVGEDAEPAYPSLEIRREALLEGALPAKLRWLTNPYVSIDQRGNTLEAVIKRYTYWEIDDASEEFAKYNTKKAARVRKLVEQRNPALTHGTLAVGTIIHLPSREEFLEPPRAGSK